MHFSQVLDTNVVVYYVGGRIDPAHVGPAPAVSFITELEALGFSGLST
jgi:hypothetical protein